MTTKVLAALFAAMAVAGWLPSARRVGASPRRPSWRPAMLAPVPGAPSATVRAGVGILVASAIALTTSAWYGLVAGPVAGLVVAVGLGRLGTGRGRRDQLRVEQELPETLDLLSAALDAGQPLRSAVLLVSSVAPPSTRPTLQRVSAMFGVGIAEADAWLTLGDDPCWGDTARDLARSSATGTPASALLRQLAGEARARRRDEQLKRARAVGVRSVLPLTCCFLPAFLLTGVVPIVAGLLGTVVHR